MKQIKEIGRRRRRSKYQTLGIRIALAVGIALMVWALFFTGGEKKEQMQEIPLSGETGQAVRAATEMVNEYDYQRALELVNRLGDDKEALFAKAFIHEKVGKQKEAVKLYQDIIEAHPSEMGAYNNLAGVLVAQGEIDEAEALLKKAIEAHVGVAQVVENLNQIYAYRAGQAYAETLGEKAGRPIPALARANNVAGGEIELEQLNRDAVLVAAAEAEKNVKDVTKTQPNKLAPRALENVSLNELASLPAREKSSKKESAPETSPSQKSVSPLPDEAALNKVLDNLTRPPKKTKESGVSIPPPEEKTKPKEKTEKDEIIEVVQNWSHAWQKKQVNNYLGYYIDGYTPDSDKFTHKAWRDVRKDRIKRPAWIKISLSNVQVKPQNRGIYAVSFTQHYEAEGYKEISKKEMLLMKHKGEYKIINEESK